MRQRVATIGPEENVIGIVTEPARDPSDPKPGSTLPNVVFLNAGVLHRVGPHRLHVSLARLLARSGFHSLRFDLSGIGDSRNLPGTLTFRKSSVADARDAMDYLTAQTGAEQFIVFGLCSGADNGVATAHADPRVVGLVLVDPPTYATYRSRLRALAGKLSRPERRGRRSLAAWALGAATRRARNAVQRAELGAARRGGRTLPLPQEYRRQLTDLLDRGVKILCVFSGANGIGYNHRDQIYESFPELRGRLQVAYFPTANHVFTELAQREALMTEVSQWCRIQFG